MMQWAHRALFLARSLQRRNIRGSTRAIILLQRSGLLDQPAILRLSPDVQMEIPLTLYAWDAVDVATYEAGYGAKYAAEVRAMGGPVTHVDVGAHIGVFTLNLLVKASNIVEVVAVEPNPQLFPYLERNLQRLPTPSQPLQIALSDYSGYARLVTPECADETGNYIEPTGQGIAVVTLDSLGIQARNLAIKIDVEGEELAVIRGAEQTIRRAAQVLVGFECHPVVIARTGRDSVECMRLLASYRNFHFLEPDTGQTLHTGTPVIGPQLAPNRVYNILGRSY